MTSLYSGAGNTFVITDQPRDPQPLCAQYDVDGCIFWEPSERADAFMRFYNKDGSEGEMCGNGLRCFIDYLHKQGLQREKYTIDTRAGLHVGWLSDQGVTIQLPPPTQICWHLEANLHGLNTGVPHLVTFLSTLDNLDIDSRAAPLRKSHNANVNFVSLQPNRILTIRTYERGVEGETLACGTGATAAALAAAHLFALLSPITVQVRSGDLLHITFSPDWQILTLEGSVFCSSTCCC